MIVLLIIIAVELLFISVHLFYISGMVDAVGTMLASLLDSMRGDNNADSD